MPFLFDFCQPGLEPVGKLIAASFFLGAVALDRQPLGIVLIPNLPEVRIVPGDLLVGLSDKELERLADVLLPDAQLPGAAVADLLEVARRDFCQRPFDDPILVRGCLANILRQGWFAVRRFEVEKSIGLALAE